MICRKRYTNHTQEHRAYLSQRMKEMNKRLNPSRIAEKATYWKGGRYLASDGYIRLYFPKHPYHDARGYVTEHRIKMEHHLKRILKPDEIVHHKDDNRTNNKIENLILMSKKQHNQHHYKNREIDDKGRFKPLGVIRPSQ